MKSGEFRFEHLFSVQSFDEVMFDLEQFVGCDEGGRVALVVVGALVRALISTTTRHGVALRRQGRMWGRRQRHRRASLGLAPVGKVQPEKW